MRLARKRTANISLLPSPKFHMFHDDVALAMSDMPDAHYDLVLIDPPYNIGKHFGEAKDAMPLGKWSAWLGRLLKCALRLTRPGGIVYMHGLPELVAHVAVQFPPEKQRWLSWQFQNRCTPTSQFWQRSQEAILAVWSGTRTPRLAIDAIREPYQPESWGKNGRGRNVYGRFGKEPLPVALHDGGALPRDTLRVPCLSAGAGENERHFWCRDCDNLFHSREIHQHREHDLIKHPTQKPLALARRLIASVPNEKGRVLIPFIGSGSEMVAAMSLDREPTGIEIDFFWIQFARSRIMKLREWEG